MQIQFMKGYILFRTQVFLFFILVPAMLFSQKIYFIYIQTEDRQAFYVRENNIVHSSTTTGYLILSKLRDSTYNYTIGFPQNKYPEQRFTLTLGAKDHGYLLKNFGQKGWGLFDLQSAAIIMSATSSAMINDSPREKIKDISAFADALVQATGDETLLEAPLFKAEAKTSGPSNDTGLKQEITLVKMDTPQAEKTTGGKDRISSESKWAIDSALKTAVYTAQKNSEPEQKTVVPEKKSDAGYKSAADNGANHPDDKQKSTPSVQLSYLPTTVNKYSESSTTEGFGLVYLDRYENGVTDTIRLLIPNPAVQTPVVKKTDTVSRKFLDMPADSTTGSMQLILVSKADSTAVNKACDPAEENDFFLLRKKMAAVKGNEEMIAEADRYFSVKCFTVQQVRNLSVLFLDDKGKYEFFKEAYPHISNKESFMKLQDQLSEDYYIDLFKSISGH